MPSYDSTLQEIKDRIDIVDLISDYVLLKKAGQNWKGLCPFHAEKTPSFTVSPAKQIYHCFGCGDGGDIFTFLVRSENLTFPEALRTLAKRAGVTLKVTRKDTVSKGENEILLAIHRDAVVFYQQNLAKNARAVEYLRGRGIDSDVQNHFSLGYAPNSWNALLTYLVRKGHKAEMLRKAGIVTQGAKGLYDTFRDRIMFPICDLMGDTIAFGGRSINGHEPKYLNSPETLIFNKSRTLYGLGRAKESIKKDGYVLLMEGYLDVITADMCGYANSVAPLGTACTREQGKLIKRFVEDVVIVFDNDSAGIKAAKNAAAILLECGLNVKVLSIPEKEDPDSYLRKRGKAAFQDLLDNPLTIIDFIMRQKGDKRLMAREAIETIAKVTDKILMGEYVRMLSEKLNIRESLVMEQLKKVQMRPGAREGKGDPEPQSRPIARPKNEVYIIKLLIQRPERSAEVCEHIVSEDFNDPVTRSIFKRIKEGTAEFNDLMSRCEGEEKDFLTGIALKEDYENPEFEDPEKALNDCIKSMRENKRQYLLQELQQKIKEAELKKDFGLLKKLQQEHTEVAKRSLK